MPGDQDLMTALAEEGALLFRYCTGRNCPAQMAELYARSMASRAKGAPFRLPAIARSAPFLLALIEPLPGRCVEYDARRHAVLVLAESCPETAPLFHRYTDSGQILQIARVSARMILEALLLPVRLSCWRLWR